MMFIATLVIKGTEKYVHWTWNLKLITPGTRPKPIAYFVFTEKESQLAHNGTTDNSRHNKNAS